jgi:hypothetical protein
MPLTIRPPGVRGGDERRAPFTTGPAVRRGKKKGGGREMGEGEREEQTTANTLHLLIFQVNIACVGA